MYLQLVIETLALSEAELLERVASLQADVATSRELTHAAFDALRALTLIHERLREQHRKTCDEYRALRERFLLEGGADDSLALRSDHVTRSPVIVLDDGTRVREAAGCCSDPPDTRRAM